MSANAMEEERLRARIADLLSGAGDAMPRKLVVNGDLVVGRDMHLYGTAHIASERVDRRTELQGVVAALQELSGEELRRVGSFVATVRGKR